MLMPGRSNSYGAGVTYRYAYNGMERDNEVSGNGNSYTTEFRQYDPRLGRWKSLDPLASIGEF
jgi:RHS repeat-associated protein